MTEPIMADHIGPPPTAGKPDQRSSNRAADGGSGRQTPDGRSYQAAPAAAARGRRLPRRGFLWLSAAFIWGLGSPSLQVARAAAASPVPGGTAEHVRVTAVRRLARSDTLLITLRVDPGYHINANPASSDYLIPTSVVFDGFVPEQVSYPPPSQLKAGFADEPLDVYQGDVVIAVRFPVGAFDRTLGLSFTLTAQACTDEICLPPAEIPAQAKW